MSLGGQNTDGTNAGEIFVQFNQDCTSLVAGSSSGYHLFALTADDGVEELYASRSGQDTCLVDRLFSSSLVALVTVAAPRKLIVCHYKKGTEICNYSYSNTILAVKLNRSVSSATRPAAASRCSPARPAAPDRVPGGVAAHPQHPRHEDPAHDPRHAAQPARAVRAVAQRGAVPGGVPRLQRRGRGADLRRRAPERAVRAERARQPAGGAGLVHVRAAPGHGVGARHRDPRVRRAAARQAARVPARRQALRGHRVPGLQRLRRLPGRHVQHGDRARVPHGRARGAGARAARRRGARLDGLAVAGGHGGRHVPAGAGGRRAGAGPRLRRRAPAGHGRARRGRRGAGGARAAPAGGHGRRAAVRVRAGRRGRALPAAAHAPPAGARAAARARVGARRRAGRRAGGLAGARRVRRARPAPLPAHPRRRPLAPRLRGRRRRCIIILGIVYYYC